MNEIQQQPLVRDYLASLDAASTGRLSAVDAADLRGDIEAHLADALPEGASEAQVRQVLDRLGEPETVVSAASVEEEDSGTRGGADPRTSGRLETASLVCLLLAIPLFFLFPVNLLLWVGGLGLLLWSRLWGVGDKVWGAVVLGAAPSVVVFAFGVSWGYGAQECSQTSGGPVECTSSVSWIAPAINVALILYLCLVVYTVFRLVRSLRRARVQVRV
ncbi:HAAS signaling domain-containing protein [Serinicoccus kebangsaanensis]|uniref:HAAS signaling domain-containing protein n=1 Tax=Serinicoccus kebangsaanensis TaxID=2602069 RepID=UPI00124CC5CA|nr:hypothetical protein [Serinicoccus kebangsaanensis]